MRSVLIAFIIEIDEAANDCHIIHIICNNVVLRCTRSRVSALTFHQHELIVLIQALKGAQILHHRNAHAQRVVDDVSKRL